MYKRLNSFCEEALDSKSLFTVYCIDEISTWMSNSDLNSQSNKRKQTKFLRQPKTDGY